jgi:hypothetical protein
MSEKIKWLKKGGGSFRMADGKIIKPNQTFMAAPEEIPVGFRDVVVPLEEIPEAKEPKILVGSAYKVEKRQNSSWYDVVNSVSDKPINDKALRLEDAKALLKELA